MLRRSVVTSDVAQVSKPAVSPISKSGERRSFVGTLNIEHAEGLETLDTADLEIRATSDVPGFSTV
jgi:hypothetical protein